MNTLREVLFVLLFLPISYGFAQDMPFPYEYPRLRYFPPNPYYSQRGFRMGHVIKLNKEGLTVWRYRWEGQLMQGFGTDQGTLLDNECFARKMRDLMNEPDARPTEDQARRLATQECAFSINPWAFSFFSDKPAERYNSFPYSPVVIYYERPTIAPQSVLTNTKNFVRGIWPIDPTLPIEESMSIRASDLPVSRFFTPVRGTIEGRVIAAVLDDVILKTYEIFVQLGPDGQNFRKLSLNSAEVFDYIVRTMFTGRMLRIDFVSLILFQRPFSTIRGYDTHFFITKVTVLDDTTGLQANPVELPTEDEGP